MTAHTLARRSRATMPRLRRIASSTRPWLASAGAAVVVALVPYLHVRGARTVTIDVGGRTVRVVTTAATPRLVLAERGIQTMPGDRLAPSAGAPLADGGRVTVRRARHVTVMADGRTTRLPGGEGTLRTVLRDAGVVLSSADSATVNGQPWTLDARLAEGAGDAAYHGRGARPAARRLIAPALARLRPGERRAPAIGGNVVRVARGRSIVLVDQGVRTTLRAAGETVRQALEQAGVRHLPGDAVHPDLDTPLAYAPEITIRRGVLLAVAADGLTRAVYSRAPTVGDALAAAGVGLAGRDIVDPPADTAVSPGLEVAITRVRDVIEWRDVEIPYRTEAVPDANRPLDEVAVLQPGVPGLARQRVEVTYHGGRVVGRSVLDEEIVREPVVEHVAYGTHVTWGTVMTEAGPMRYWRKLRTYATSYSASRAGTPRSAPWYGRTRIGEVMRKGIVAVDPRVIPLRTNLYVEGYGLGLAGDTGGGVKRLHIDLGYDDDNYIGWHQYVDVYLLEPAPPPDRMPWVLP